MFAELASSGRDGGCPAGRDNLDVDVHESVGHQRLRTPGRHKAHVAEDSMSTYPEGVVAVGQDIVAIRPATSTTRNPLPQHDEGLNAVPRRKPGVWSGPQSFCVR